MPKAPNLDAHREEKIARTHLAAETMKPFHLTLAFTLILCFTFPTAFQGIKAVALLTLLAPLFFLTRTNRLMHRGILLSALAFSAVGLSWSLYGLLMGNPGAIRVLTVMTVYPILFTLLTPYYSGDTDSLKKLFVFSSLLLVTIDSIYLIAEIASPGNVITSLLNIIHGENAVVDNAENYLKFTLPNVATSIFFLPFITCLVLNEKARPTLLIALIGLVLIALASGRRAILVTSIAGPLLAYLTTIGAKRSTRLSIPTILIFFVVIAISSLLFFNLWPEYVASRITSIFDFTEDRSNIERNIQFTALWDGFASSPIFGLGAGAAAEYARSEDMPWAYELYYVSMLFQYGILGTAIYAAGIVFLTLFLILQVRKKGRKSFEFYYLAGFLSFLIASATNPYIAKFDYMWIIFIPVAMMNCSLLKKTSKIRSPNEHA